MFQRIFLDFASPEFKTLKKYYAFEKMESYQL